MEGIDLLVALLASGGVVQSLAAVMKSWLKARKRALKLTVKVDGTERQVEFNADDPQQAKLFLEAIMGQLPADDRETPR